MDGLCKFVLLSLATGFTRAVQYITSGVDEVVLCNVKECRRLARHLLIFEPLGHESFTRAQSVKFLDLNAHIIDMKADTILFAIRV